MRSLSEKMIKKYWKELGLAVIITGIVLWLVDVLGDLFFAEPETLSVSTEIMLFGLIALFLPALIGSIPSGYLIAKKTQEIKSIVFVPALGAALAGIILILFSAVSMLLLSDADWQNQLNEVKEFGEIFGEMTLEEFRYFTLFSVVFGGLFIAVFNFGIGLAGGFAGGKLFLATKKA